MTHHSPALDIARAPPSGAMVDDLLLPPPTDKGGAGAAAPLPATGKKARIRKLLLAGAALVALVGASGYGWGYWSVGQYQVSTDDAYIQADTTVIAPKVSGYLREVLIGDNESVKAGQVLARIDERDYRVALDQARADVAAAEAAIAAKKAQLDVQQAVIDAARATLDVDQENKRDTQLAATGYGSVQHAEQAQSRFAGAQATIQRDNANLASASKQLDLLQAEIAQTSAALVRAQAAQNQAELNLGYTTIVAPLDGVVGNRTLRAGQFVQAGTQLMSVVPVDSAYVVANFKETQLTDVHEGQPVEIAVDMFPGQVVHGHVDSIAPASGQEFALLPPGNFTKVVQRIPVKITFRHDVASLLALRPGMSVTPTINTFSVDRTRRADLAVPAPTSTSEGSCHVQSRPVSLDRRAAELWRSI